MTRAEYRRLARGLAAMWFFGAVITVAVIHAAITGDDIL